MSDKRVFGVGRLNSTSEGLFGACIKDLVSYIADNYEMSRVEATTMATIVVGAITQKLFSTGIVKMPFGDIKFMPMPKDMHPLRVKIYTPLYITKFLNLGDTSRATALQACMKPEHYTALSILQDKAYTYKVLKEKEKNDQIQEGSS